MDLIKKNILLFSILGITLIIVGILSYMVLVTHSKMGEYITKVNSLRVTIKKLGKETPRPVKDNVVRINEDIEGYKKLSSDIVQLYGQPNFPALVAMCKVLNVKPEDMRKEFKEFWSKNNNPGITRGLVLRTYINKQKEKYGVKKWNDALVVFQKEIEKVTYEKINGDNIKDIYFFTLGLPRVLRDVLCKKFITKMRKKLIPLLDDVFLPKEVQLLTFREAAYTTALPKWYNIPDIIYSWSIIEDIVSRLAGTGIREVSEFSKRGLIGHVDGEYTYYRFNLTVHGSEKSIRKFIDNLYKGYREHRVYIVREISLKRDYDMAAILLKKSAGLAYSIEENRNTSTSMDQGMGMGAQLPGENRVESADMRKKKLEAEEERKLREAEELKLPFYKRKSYGKVILGVNMQVEAEIAIDYVVYNGFKINLEQK